MNKEFIAKNYMRDLKLPFCPGCGCFNVINCFLRAVHELGYEDFRKFVFCSGIGCSSWIPSPYFKADSIHITHGRSIAAATGVKLMRPDLNVVVFGGDGDIVGIGLSHLIHAARRNLDITVIMVNNMIYSMTGGQVAPTTPHKILTTTTPYGNFEYPLDAAKLVATCNASYVARWTAAHSKELKESMKKAILTKGFAFIEVISQCPTMFGRRIGIEDASKFLKMFKESSIKFSDAEKMSEKELEGKITVGEIKSKYLRKTLVENIYATIEEVKKIES